MVREMVGGCCVCLDDRGWDENPLVYCDGHGCNVAVHQACYGIVKVPSGPWFCCKCQSTERIARVDQRQHNRQKSKLKASLSSDKKCELCPLKEGALKRTDTQGWAHVVCALYIPEVRFGNVTTMEPIILASVPHDRYLKTCYICEENGKESKTSCGACMACNKPGCKLSFHVTCAQAKRLLCEESGHGNGNVQYVGYCANHWAKKPTNKTNADADSKKLNKKNRIRTESMSSTEGPTQNKRGRKPNPNKLSSCTPPPSSDSFGSTPNGPVSTGKGDSHQNHLGASVSVSMNSTVSKSSNSQSRTPYSVSQVQFSVTDLIVETKDSKETNISSGEAAKDHKVKKEENTEKPESSKSYDKSTAHAQKKRKLMEKVSSKIVKRQKLLKKGKDGKLLKAKKKILDSKKATTKTKKTERKVIPEPNHLDVYENGKLRPLSGESSKLTCPSSFQELLEYQWNQSAQFILQKASHFDVASLLSTLHQLRSDNVKLESRLTELAARRDRLLAANARLSLPLNLENSLNTPKPLSSMLSKLRDEATDDAAMLNSARAPYLNGDVNNDTVAFNGLVQKNGGSLTSSPSDSSPNQTTSSNGSKKTEPKSNQSTPDKKEKKGNSNNSAKGSKPTKSTPASAGKKEKTKTKAEKVDQDLLQQHFLMNGGGQQSSQMPGSMMQSMYPCTSDPSGLLQPGPSILDGGPSSFIHQMLHQRRQPSASLPAPDPNAVGMLGLMQPPHPFNYSTPNHNNSIGSSFFYGGSDPAKGNSHKK